MGEEEGRNSTGKAQANSLIQREAAHRASAPRTGASPSAVEATLASISAEVMAEAGERLNRRTTPRKAKT